MANNKNFKFLLLNKRDADLKNQINNINNILNTHKPDFMVINELQKYKYDTTSKYNFPGYKMEHDQLDITDGWSRTGILIKSNIKYKRRLDLEDSGLSTVWIQVGLHGSKHFLVHGMYRQFQRQGINNTKSIPAQTARWERLTNKWKQANDEDREVISLGDTNLDSLQWDKNWENLSQYDKQKSQMVKILKEKILQNGTTKINKDFTRQDNIPDRRKSCLDQIFTNKPEKMNNTKTHYSTFSDHAMVEFNKNIKKKTNTKRYIKIRSMKNFNNENSKNNILNHELYISTMYENNTDKIAENITKIIQDSAKPEAPIKKIQISSKNKQHLSNEAKESLIERDIAQKIAKDNPTPENIRNYKNLRNFSTNLIAKERYLQKREIFEKETSMKQKRKLAKSESGQDLQSTPTIIREGQKKFYKAI